MGLDHWHHHWCHVGDMVVARLMADEWYTPAWVFDALGLTFDLDVAAPTNNASCVPCKHKYTIDDDGLSQTWHGLVWMNPPYSKPAPWVARFLEHANGVALLPVGGGNWILDLWNSDAMAVWMGRIRFNSVDGISNGYGTQNHVLWAIGPTAKKAATLLPFARIR